MLTKTLKPGLFTVLAMLPLAAFIPTQVFAPSTTNQLEGVWEVTGTPDPSSGLSEFVNVAAITKGGKITNVDPDVGTGVGDSYRITAKTYAAGFFGYIDVGVPAQYEIQTTLKMRSKDHFTGLFRTIVSDMSGNPLFQYDGTLDGQRKLPQPY